MMIAALGAVSLPTNFLAQKFSAWGIGALSLVGLLIHLKAEDKKMRYGAYGLVAASVIIGMVQIFF